MEDLSLKVMNLGSLNWRYPQLGLFAHLLGNL
jgi:hypothetical protein